MRFEERVEAGLVGFVEVVGSLQERQAGPEQVGIEGGGDMAAGFAALQVAAHQSQPGSSDRCGGEGVE